MKILYYNWVQFDNINKSGGGVNIYQYNLIKEFIKDENLEISFLSAGTKYNPFIPFPYIKKTKNIFSDKCATYEIINSPIFAPAFSMFTNLKRFNDDIESYKIFKKFIKEYGPFDVIHINNIEGLSCNILKIKNDYPETKIILSIHNYMPICPIVTYFQDNNKQICHDFKNGQECLNCSLEKPSKKDYRNKIRNYFFDITPNIIKPILKPIINIITKVFEGRKYLGSMETMLPEYYAEYRRNNIKLINKYVDKVLAVSNRVKEIMISHGILADKIITSYIGTDVARNQLGYSVAPLSDKFTVAYLGYERIDKGYFFFIESLAKLDESIKEKINVVLAVKDIHQEKALQTLSGFNNIEIYNGYSHKELPDILSKVNLGVVPVLWEDNLPQVAIEMVAFGVPVLCSSFGGASELCKSDLFKFRGGGNEPNDFISKLINIVKNPDLLNEYWKNHTTLTTMDKHCAELLKIYKGD